MPEKPREKLTLPERAFILIYAAEFSVRKGQAVLLQAMKRLPEKAGRSVRVFFCMAFLYGKKEKD